MKKLSIEDLKVSSFVTEEARQYTKGGARTYNKNCTPETNTCYTWGCYVCSDQANPCVG